MEAVKEGDIPLLEESDDSAFQGLHPLRLSGAKVLRVNSCLLRHLFIHLLPILGELVALGLVSEVLLLHDDLFAHFLDDVLKGLLEVVVLDEVIAQVHTC